MPPETVPTDSGPLTVEQAVESLLPQAEPEQDNEAPEAPLEAAEEPEQTEAETSSAEETPEEPETLEEGEEASEEEPPAVVPVDPPKYWSVDAKAKFAELPPELQAVVLEQEGPREAATAKARQEAFVAQQEAAKVQQLADGLTQFLPGIRETFKSRWDGVDWVATLAEHGPEATLQFQFQHDAEKQQLAQAEAAATEAATLAHQNYVRSESAKLDGTPLAAAEARQEVAKYLLDQAFAPETLKGISAAEMTIAHKAMLWDRAQKAPTKPLATKPAAPAKPVIKPGAVVQSSQNRGSNQAGNRFAQTRSVDDAVALLLAKK